MQYDFSLAPGASQRFEVDGKFFKNVASSGLIRVTTSKGEYVDLVAGQGVYGVEFKSLSVKNLSGATNTGAVIIGNFDFRDDTINGTIRMLDDSYVKVRNKDSAKTLAAQAFMGCSNWLPLSNGNFNSVIHCNPAGSGKNVIVSSFRWFGNTARVNLHVGTYVPAGTTKCRNKLVGGADSLSILVNEDITPANMTALGAPLMSTNPNNGMGAINSDTVYLGEPIIVPPGKSIVFSDGATGQTEWANLMIEFTEEV